MPENKDTRNFFQKLLNLKPGGNSSPAPLPALTKDRGIDDRPNLGSLPSGRTSVPATNNGLTNILGGQNSIYRVVNHQFLVEVIPVIRSLMMHNPDVSQAIHNIVTLGNTGHKVFFDRRVPDEMVDQMRNHLANKRKDWASGQAGMNGLINKFFSQILVGGALSFEAVVNQKLTGVESVILVNPEEIVFTLDKRSTKYIAHQRPQQGVFGGSIPGAYGSSGLIKLNPNTYRYFALNGDTEIPYGFPPYLSVLPRIDTQTSMETNIDFIVDQMGLAGFMEALIQKPDQSVDGPESDIDYKARLDNLIVQAKDRLKAGFKDGVVVGFKDDHEFKFHSASKSYESAVSLFKNNEQLIGSALKQDMSLMGRDYNTSTEQLTVVFMKMLSELRNVQNLIKSALEFIYALELRLAGFNFDFMDVRFDKSTIQDGLKYQQSEEIKIRNVKDKLILGIISLNGAADELGYEVPDQQEPRVSWEILAGSAPAKDPGLETDNTAKKAGIKKQKGASEKKGRQKNKPTSA